MSKNVIINGVEYNNVPYVNIPLASGTGNAKFVDTDSGNAVASDIRSGKKAWVGGSEVTGTQIVRTASDVTVSGKKVTTPAGIYDSQVEKSIADGSITPSAAIVGNEIGDTTTNYEISITPVTTVATAGYISGNKNGSTIKKYIKVEEKTATPTTQAVVVTPTDGKLLEKVTVNAVTVGGNASPSDVMNGKTFLSAGSLTVKTGTATVPIVGQDSTTKVLTIS